MTELPSLDDLLGAWAGAVRLPGAEAAAIRRAIVGETRSTVPPGLPPEWWRDFTTQISEVMVRAGHAGHAGRSRALVSGWTG